MENVLRNLFINHHSVERRMFMTTLSPEAMLINTNIIHKVSLCAFYKSKQAQKVQTRKLKNQAPAHKMTDNIFT